jgi:hypothetical protein
VPLTGTKLPAVPLPTLTSARRKPLTVSENVAVTAKGAAFVGLGDGVESSSVGATLSTVYVCPPVKGALETLLPGRVDDRGPAATSRRSVLLPVRC